MNTDKQVVSAIPAVRCFADVPAFRRLDRPTETGGVRAFGTGSSVGPLRRKLEHRPAAAAHGRSTGGETEPAVAPVRGYRNGSRTRTLTGTFGKTRHHGAACALAGCGWRHHGMEEQGVRAYQRRTKAADAPSLRRTAGTNTRRCPPRAAALFGGVVRQGDGEPGVAQGADRIGRSERTTTKGRADRAAILPRTVVRVRSTRKPRRSRDRRHRRARGRTERCCSPSSGWAGRPRTPGERSWTTSPAAAFAVLSSSTPTAARAPRARSRPCGTTCPSAVYGPQASATVGVRA